MRQSLLLALVLVSLLLLAGLGGCEKKSPAVPPAPSNVTRGEFINDQQLAEARHTAQVNQEACAKWCGGPISEATNNPNKIGCSAERCKELYPVGSKRYRRCEGTDCNDCNRYKDTYYSVNCDETLDGCLIMLSSIGKCQ